MAVNIPDVNSIGGSTTGKISTTVDTLSNIGKVSGANIDMPDITSLTKNIDNLQENIKKLQDIGLPSTADVPKTIIKTLESQELFLTQRQISKKLLLMQNKQMKEETAQIIVYGKAYYKDGKLYDNDKKDPNCVANEDDEDYISPIDENHPMWDDINNKIKSLKESLLQIGKKIGEFLIAIPAAIATIATSLIAAVSSIIIIPFGSGIPPALTAIMTMVATIKELQSKISQFLPFMDIISIIGLVVGKSAQFIISQINAIFIFIGTIVELLTNILGLLGKITGKINILKKKTEEQGMEVKVKADPSKVDPGETTKLEASTSGGDWDYKYQWTDSNGSVIGNQDTITVKPYQTTTYTCKVTDGTGITKTETIKIKVNIPVSQIVGRMLDEALNPPLSTSTSS